jgi:hypothetical protein
MAAALMGCSSSEDDTASTHPVIRSISVTPDTVLPQSPASLEADAYDPDNGPDSLSYTWLASAGAFEARDVPYRVDWRSAPEDSGRYTIRLVVSDGENSVTDSVHVVVSKTVSYPDLDARIFSPGQNESVAVGDSIEFRARLFGLGSFDTPQVEVTWASSLDGELHSGTTDSLGFSEFKLPLSQGVHSVTFTGVVDGVYSAMDNITVNVLTSSLLTLHPIHREYLANRLTWIHESDSESFVAYTIYRASAGATQPVKLVEIADQSVTSYRDTTAVLGRAYEYWVEVEYGGGVSNTSGHEAIVTGVFTSWIGNVPDMHYENDLETLFISTPDVLPPSVNTIDVTANNPDGYYAYQDTLKKLTGNDADSAVVILFNPVGFVKDDANDELYVASIGDPLLAGEGNQVGALWKISTASQVGGLNLVLDLHDNGDYWRSALNYLAYDPTDDVVYATTDNGYPYRIGNLQGVPTFSRIQDSRVVWYESVLLVDAASRSLYLSEIGGFPASLWEYDISTAAPSFVQSDEHNTLGYNLEDMAFGATNSELLLACESPEYVQVVSTADFTVADSISTGPDARAIFVVNDFAYIGVGRYVQKWNLASESLVDSWEFSMPILRRGVEVSSDESILMVATEDAENGLTWVFIIYLD